MTFNNDFIVCIGAREGSRRIKNKNLRTINEKPLIYYSIQAGHELKLPVYVSSDSTDILTIAEKYTANLVTRPTELATETSTDTEWIMHLVREYYLVHKFYPKYLIFLRPTTPLRDTKVLIDAIQFFKDNKCINLRSVEPVKEAPEKLFRIRNGELVPYMSEVSMIETNHPNQNFEIAYRANGYIDIISVEQLFNYNDLYLPNCTPFITRRTVEIDVPEDLLYAEFIKNYDKY